MPDVKENAKEVEVAAEVRDGAKEDREPEAGSYYYDDSHGYEDFDPDGEEESE